MAKTGDLHQVGLQAALRQGWGEGMPISRRRRLAVTSELHSLGVEMRTHRSRLTDQSPYGYLAGKGRRSS